MRIPGSEIYEELNPKELACESDAAIYQRLQDTCFQFQGTWKRWLPFYGIVDVREVNVRRLVQLICFTNYRNCSSNLLGWWSEMADFQFIYCLLMSTKFGMTQIA